MDRTGKLAVLSVLSLFLPYFLCSVMIISCIIYSYGKKDLRVRMFQDKSWVLLGGFFFVSLFSALIFRNSFGILGAIIILLEISYLLFMRAIMTQKLYKLIIKLICAGSVVSTFVGIVQFTIIRTGNTYPFWEMFEKLKEFPFIYDGMYKASQYFKSLSIPHTSFRSISTFLNANYFAMIASFVIIICIYKLTAKAQKHRLFYIIVLISNLISLVIADSRSGIISVIAGTIMILIFRKKYRALKIIGGVAVLGGALVVGSYLLFPNNFPSMEELLTTMDKRLKIWNGVISIIPENLLIGKGFMSYFFSYQAGDVPQWAIHSHNLFLDCVINFGIIGTGCFLAYISAQMIQIVKKIKSVKSDVWILMFGVAVVIFVAGLTDAAILGIETSLMAIVISTGKME